jgi:hypothetical protein
MNTEERKAEVIIVSSISKQGGRYLLAIPRKFQNDIQPFAGKPVRAKIEVLV